MDDMNAKVDLMMRLGAAMFLGLVSVAVHGRYGYRVLAW